MIVKSTLNDFKAFILRGNVIDLAVAVLIGAAFGQVVQAFTTDIISPLITLFGGSPKGLDTIWIFGGFKIGPFLDVVLSFLITAAILFFFVVRPVNYLMSFRKTQLPVEPTTRECPYCVSAIPLKATRCAFCTAEVPALEPVAVNKA